MGSEINSVAKKLLSSYDTNNDNKIKGEEIALFKQDCKTIFAEAYGKDSKQYQNLSQKLDNTQINFAKMEAGGITTPGRNNYEKQKYQVTLSTKFEGKKLKENPLNLTDLAGVLVHEMEHIQQDQHIYDKTKKETGSSRNAFGNLLRYAEGNNEVCCEIERMNFYKKTGTFSLAEKYKPYLKYLEATKNVETTPDIDKKAFFEKFDYKLFAQEVKGRYKEYEFNDENITSELKELVGE